MGTAVITGCTRGIGAAITEKFLDHGCDICGCYSKDVGNAKWFLESLGECREKLTLFQADLSTWEGIGRFIEGVKAAVSSVDYLVLNAGMTDYTPFREISHEKWEKVLRLNLYAPLFITQGLDSVMNGGGWIIFIGTVLGQYPHAVSLPYAVSKAGLHQMAKNLVKEYADRKITVNVVAPGFVDTPWQKNKTPEHKKRIEDKIALGRFAEPREVADLCWSIVENPYINGAVVNIDGGYDYR